MRRTIGLDGPDWEIQGYLWLDAALMAAAREPGHADRGWLPALVPGSVLDDLWRAGEFDHRGDPKPAFHAVARAYAPVVVCAAFDRAAWGGRDRFDCLRVTHHRGPAAMGVVVEDTRPIETPGWPELDDNGFDLLPGEGRELAYRWVGAVLAARALTVSAWNVGPMSREAAG